MRGLVNQLLDKNPETRPDALTLLSIDQICHCSKTQKVDGFGHHLLKCNQITTNNGKSQQNWAHNNFLNNFIDICKFNGIKVDKEIDVLDITNETEPIWSTVKRVIGHF